MRSGLALILCVFSLLAGCGGAAQAPDSPISNNPPPPPPLPPPVIGVAGGTVTETGGATIVVPAGALTENTTIRIAKDSTGAPVIPAGLTNAGSLYVITPHGGNFAVPIEVSIPMPAITLQPNQVIKLAKAQPNGEWMVLDDTVVVDGKLKAKVKSFSFFMTVVINYTLPILQVAPLQLQTSLDCGTQGCTDILNTVTATYTAVGNNGAFPAGCENGSLAIYSNPYGGFDGNVYPIERTGGTATETLARNPYDQWTFAAAMRCGGYTTNFGLGWSKTISWAKATRYPLLGIMSIPSQLDVVDGMPASLEVVIGGGAGKEVRGVWTEASYYDRAIVDWQRSDDNGRSWRDIARSYENEANPLPFGTGTAWRPWSVSHGFIANVMDQGALIRVQACYTPLNSSVPGEPCLFSEPTRLNVLQQSGLPAITSAPRSVLVRTGQTASLSATVTGLPAPTLRWQTRAANSNGAWSDVTTGTGATSANYTTAATAVSDNGTQYRILATNAAGSAASTAVTVSVSDLDVAPSITTQPASLSVASGSDAVFAVDARGTEAMSYQWYRNGSALAGANSPVLRLTGVTLLNSGSFTVTVTNSAGGADSNSATLNVYPGTPAAVAPTIVTQPANLTVNVGNTATFAVGVDGSGPFTFQWRRNGFNIPGATKAVLSLPSVVADASGTYSVVVSNSVGPAVTSADASLSVSPGGSAAAPEIATQPSTIIVAPGGSAVLAVAATGSGPLYYQWALDGIPIGGAEEAVLMLPNIGEDDEGDYSVTITNGLGSVVSQSASVILLGAPFITQPPVNHTVVDADTTQFSVIAGGSHLRYQWLRNGIAIPGATLSYYNTPQVYVADSGAVYSVIVSNGAGIEVSAPAVLTVIAFVAPSVTAHPISTSVVAGNAAPMCATFGGSPPFEVQMTRWSGTAWLPVLAARRIDDNLPACTTTPVLQLADNGAMFRFEAIAGPGQAYSTTTNPATITVTAPSAVTTTILASRATSGATANNRSGLPSISADGNIIAFTSDGTNLVPNFNGDAFTAGYAFVRNLSTGMTTLINQTPAGERSSRGVGGLKLAAGGRYAIFSSLAADLVADDTNGSQDVFVRDLQTGTTRRVSLRADGTETEPAGNGQSDMQLNISADGRFVSFLSNQDLISNGPPAESWLYLRDLQSGSVRRVATSAQSVIGYSVLSDDGKHLAWRDGTFTPGDTRNFIVHYDAEANTSEEVFSIDSTNSASFLAQGVSISGDGRYIAFTMRSPSTFNGSTYTQVLVIDRNNPGHITVASGDSNGFGNGHSIEPVVSDDGHVLFFTNAGNLTGNFANAVYGTLVVRDSQSSAMGIAARRANGTPVLTISGYFYHALSSDGTAVAFVANELDVSGSGINEYQVYVAPRP